MNDNNTNPLVVSYLTLRQMIGWIGLMPLFVRAGGYVFEGIRSTDSISAYYYTGMRDVFVASLVLAGVLITCYRAPGLIDNVTAIVAGLGAIGIALFPMNPRFASEILAQYPQMKEARCYIIRGALGFHFIFVAIFFASTFFLVAFRFSAHTPAIPTREKVKRNMIYRICGIAMLLAFITIGILAFAKTGGSIFWPETVAVIAFGVAWLVKGQTILKDSFPAPASAD